GRGGGSRRSIARDHHAADADCLEARHCREGLLSNNVGKRDGADYLVIDQHVDNRIAFLAELPDAFVLRRESAPADIVRAHDPDTMPFDDGLGALTREALEFLDRFRPDATFLGATHYALGDRML